MTDLIVNNVVETPASATLLPGQPEYVDGRAIIGYHSILDDYGVTITSTSEASGFSVNNVKSRLTHSGWKLAAGGTQYMNIVCDPGRTVDYLAIAGHNLWSKSATIDLQYSDDGGSTWVSITGSIGPTSDAPVMYLFSSQGRLRFRLAVTMPGTDYPTISVILLGERLSLQRGIYVGHQPAPFSRVVRTLTEESEGGQIIGTSVMSLANETEVSMTRITPTWYREKMDPFMKKAVRGQPFFFMWNTDDRYKGEVLYATLRNKPTPKNEHQSFMALDLSMRGLA